MTKIYTPEQLAYLREGYKLMDIGTLTDSFNREYRLKKTQSQIKSTLTNHNITCGRKVGNATGISLVFTLEQKYFIQELYKVMTLAEIAEALLQTYGVKTTTDKLKAFTANHKILSGRTGYFEKGIVPWNTGTKGVVKPNSGNFKSGHCPANQKPIGHERICSKDGYVLIKVDEVNPYTGFRGRYRHKHVVIWEQANGPVPDGFVVSFVDGDKANIELSNLELIDRNHLCRMNKHRVYDLPNDLIPTMKNVVKLKVQMHKRSPRELEKYGQ